MIDEFVQRGGPDLSYRRNRIKLPCLNFSGLLWQCSRMPKFPSTVVRLLEELVSCPSVQPEGESGGTVPGEAAMAERAAGFLRALGADVELQPAAASRPNVVAVFEPRRKVRATIA